MSSTATTKRLLTVGEAAAYLRSGVSTLNKLRSSGGGPTFVKMQSSIRYLESDLERYVQQRRQQSTAGKRRAA
jgi:predicted DNA-binding transcriptional regulator AlpA